MGGAKNCPETPRQRMIAMMYLVLTAMLALNVSTDILNGFKLVDNSLHSSIEANESRCKNMMSDFKAITDQNPEKNQEWYDLALQLTQKSDELVNYIKDFKYQIVVLADGAKNADPEARNISSKDNLDVTAQYAINQGNGAILRQKIDEYRYFLIEVAGGAKGKVEEFDRVFSTASGRTNDGDVISWEASVFEGMPVGASVTILTKIQNDVRAAESEMIDFIMARTDATDFRVNKLQALVIPESKYVMRGGRYRAQIVLSAVDSTQIPVYYIGNSRIENGIYEVMASGIGAHKYAGEIVLPKADGEELHLPFDNEYIVGEPSVTISNTDLNIMYRGYDNKFSVSVPGIASEDVKVTVSGASTKKQGGYWIIRPEGGKEVTINVQANIDGRMQSMGSQTYRVKALPKPGVFLKSGSTEYSEGAIPRNAILNDKAQIIASYGPDGLLDLKYTITGFVMDTPYGVAKSNGDTFTKAQMDILKKLKKGNMVVISDVQAKDMNGNPVRGGLPGVFFKMN